MSVVSRIKERDYKQALGRYNKQLVIRLLPHRTKESSIQYSLVLTRIRSKPGSRLSLLGKFVLNRYRNKHYGCLFINREKVKEALTLGAVFHASVYKLILI